MFEPNVTNTLLYTNSYMCVSP